MAFTRVPGFSLAQSAFHFRNSWDPAYVYPVVTLPVVGSVAAGNANNGLCGGFVLAALDLFLHTPRLLPPSNTQNPADGSTLFNYIYQRLIDSWELSKGPTGNVGKDIEWILTLDPTTNGSGLRQRVIAQEWPKIKADIDAGRPSPLALVGGLPRSAVDIEGIKESLKQCHQVLAYGYEVDNANTLTLEVYDNNDPSLNATISLKLSEPAPYTPIASTVDWPKGMRGFFRSAYTLRDPSAIVPPAGWDWRNLHKPSGANIVGSVGTISVLESPTAPSRAHTFVAGNDGKVWCHELNGSSSQWTDLGKPPTAKVRRLLGAVNAKNTPTSPERPHVFIEGNDSNLWCLWWSGSSWSWLNMKKPPGPGAGVNIVEFVGAVSVMDTPSSPARPHLFVTGSDGNVWCRWSSGSSWSWLNMEKPPTANVRRLLGAVNAKNTPTSPERPHVFIEGDDFNLWCLWSSGSSWSWLNMGKPPAVNIRARLGAATLGDTPTSMQRPSVFFEGDDYNLWSRYAV